MSLGSFRVTCFVDSQSECTQHSLCSLFQCFHFLTPCSSVSGEDYVSFSGCQERIRYSAYTYWLVFYWLTVFQRSENSSSFCLPDNNLQMQKFTLLENVWFLPACLTLTQIPMFWHETYLHFFFFPSKEKSIFLISCSFPNYLLLVSLFLTYTCILSYSCGWYSSLVS